MNNLFLSVDPATIDWSRAQFALTAIYHWLFVPLTLGLAVIMGIMETCYYRTKKQFWKDCARFWQKLFGINFAMGVATGIILEFEFGTNWSNYSCIRRRHLWRSACYQRHCGVLYGIYFRGSHVLRMGEGVTWFSSCFNMAHRTWCHNLSMVDSGGKLLGCNIL